jgi:hypothetical protein
MQGSPAGRTVTSGQKAAILTIIDLRPLNPHYLWDAIPIFSLILAHAEVPSRWSGRAGKW